MATSPTAGAPVPPFEFRRIAFLVEVTPLRAGSLAQFLTSLTLAPEASLFYHLHRRFFREPEGLPEYAHDFAGWAADALGDGLLAERLANVNLARSGSLAGVRREMSVLVAERIEQVGGGRTVLSGFEFIFCLARTGRSCPSRPPSSKSPRRCTTRCRVRRSRSRPPTSPSTSTRCARPPRSSAWTGTW